MFVVMFKDHGKLNCEQRVFGPFDNWDDAYDAMCACDVPAFTPTEKEEDRNGWRFIQELEWVNGAKL